MALREVIEAIQDATRDDGEAIATLVHMLGSGVVRFTRHPHHPVVVLDSDDPIAA